MGVGAADAEGGDAGAAGSAGGGPGHGLGQEPDLAGGPVDVRGGLVDVQGLGQQPVPHGHDHLDHAGHARGRRAVADVGLDRAQPQRPVAGAVPAVGGQQGLGLDRVTQPGPGAVRLHRVDLGRGQPGSGQRGLDDPLLGRPVGGGQAVAGPVLVDGRAADQGQHPVAPAAGVGQPLQHDHPGPLGPARPVGRGRERLAPPVGRQPPLPAELHKRVRHRHDGTPRRPGPCRTPPTAAPGRPGGPRPARTSTPCRPSPPGPPARRRKRSAPTPRSWRFRSARWPSSSLPACSSRVR